MTDQPFEPVVPGLSETDSLHRLGSVIGRLRVECPWDRQQTHRSLLNHLVEETAEVVDAVEVGDDTDLREELGDVLCQVYFHAAIAEEEGRFTLSDVADGIADKLVRRHPYVFGSGDVPDDLSASWEARKKAEKGRSSSLDGIPEALNVIPRAAKVISRSRSHHVDVSLPDEPITAEDFGNQLMALLARARASDIDPDQAARDALRRLEDAIRAREAAQAAG
jgi:XTP/dITP diphosphohydrolase